MTVVNWNFWFLKRFFKLFLGSVVAGFLPKRCRKLMISDNTTIQNFQNLTGLTIRLTSNKGQLDAMVLEGLFVFVPQPCFSGKYCRKPKELFTCDKITSYKACKYNGWFEILIEQIVPMVSQEVVFCFITAELWRKLLQKTQKFDNVNTCKACQYFVDLNIRMNICQCLNEFYCESSCSPLFSLVYL